MQISRDEVLLVDKLKHCIYRFDVAQSILQSFMGICGNGDLVTAYEERQFQNIPLHSPVYVSYLIVRSVGHLMIESEQSDLYIVRIQPFGTVAYRQPALEHDDGFVGSGRILYSSESQLLSLLVSADASDSSRKCYVRQSNYTSTSIEAVDCDLSVAIVKNVGMIALVGSKIYKHNPYRGGFSAGLARVDLHLGEVSLISECCEGSHLIVYSEPDGHFLLMNRENETIGGRQIAIYLHIIRSSVVKVAQRATYTSTVSAEGCAYLCLKSKACATFRFLSNERSCLTFQKSEHRQHTVKTFLKFWSDLLGFT